MQFLNRQIDKLLAQESNSSLLVLNTIFPQVIPFNRPHKFKIQKLTSTDSEIFAPLIRNNKNHLGTMHAIAQATIGELAAGLLLLRNFGISNYRYILKNISINYTYQAKTDLTAIAQFETSKIGSLKQQLEQDGKVEIELITIIKNNKMEVVSEVKTNWQLKSWSKVKTNTP